MPEGPQPFRHCLLPVFPCRIDRNIDSFPQSRGIGPREQFLGFSPATEGGAAAPEFPIRGNPRCLIG